MRKLFLMMFVALVSGLVVTSVCRAEPINDGSIFFDHFTGTGDLTTGSNWSTVGGTIAQDGDTLATITAAGANYAWSKLLDFSASPDDWVATVRFRVNGTMDTIRTGNCRQADLFRGGSPAPGGSDTREVIGFDLRLEEIAGDLDGTASTFDMTWWGFEGDYKQAVSISGGSGLSKETFYTVTAHRKSDDTVDIYLGDSLIDTKPLIVGVRSGNVGQENPDMVIFGSLSGDIAVNITHDFLKVGVVPEPSTLVLLAVGGLLLVAFRWFRRK